MKKLRIALALVLVISLSACGAPPPSAIVEGWFTAFYTSPKQLTQSLLEDTLGDVDLSLTDEQTALLAATVADLISAYKDDISHKVLSEAIDGDTAVVEVSITYPDATPALRKAAEETAKRTLLSSAAPENRAAFALEQFCASLSEAVTTTEPAGELSVTVQLPLQKENGYWVLDTGALPVELINALLCNAITATSQLGTILS